jgi:hypothetical protein
MIRKNGKTGSQYTTITGEPLNDAIDYHFVGGVIDPYWKAWLKQYCQEISDGKRNELECTDFGNRIAISFEDGSGVTFKHALAVKNEERRELAVFTEHNGYHVFPLESITSAGGNRYIVVEPFKPIDPRTAPQLIKEMDEQGLLTEEASFEVDFGSPPSKETVLEMIQNLKDPTSYVGNCLGENINLDGSFTVEELRAIAWLLENYPHAATPL